MTTETNVERYTAGQIIEYTSFAAGGWSLGQVFRYAPDYEQTRTCPNCDRRVVPLPVDPQTRDDAGLFQCPVCLANDLFPALDPLVYIYNLDNGKPWGKPFTAREGQLRLPTPVITIGQETRP